MTDLQIFPVREEIPNFRFRENDGFSRRGVEYTFVKAAGDEYHLQNTTTGVVEGYTGADMNAMFEDERDPLVYLPRRGFSATAKPQWFEDRIMNLLPKQKAKLTFQLGIIKELSLLHAEGEVSRTDSDVAAALPQLIKKLTSPPEREHGKRLTYKGKKKLKKEQDENTWMPAASTVRQWYRAFERSGDPLVLLDDYGKNRGTKRLEPEVEAKLNVKVQRFLSTDLFMTDVHDELVKEIAGLNRSRAEDGQLKPPCIETLRARVRELPPAMRAMRRGPGAVELEYSIDRGGTERLRPFERLEIDEWEVDTHTVLALLGEWEKMSDKERAAVPRIRVWVTAAIDVASGVSVAADVHMCRPSIATAIAALDMSTRDKTSLAKELGCEAAWPYKGSAEEVATDSGSWFTSDEFRLTALLLGACVFYPPTGAASARGTIERFFRTLAKNAIQTFPGRIWKPWEGHDTKEAEKAASIAFDQIRRLLIRFIVDVYHHTPRDGGETPDAAWRRLKKRYGVIPPPNGFRRRAIFGKRTEVTITAEGVLYHRVPYQSDTLQWIRRNRTRKVWLTVLDENLGEATVFDGRDCYPIPSKFPEFQGMSLLEWNAICDAYTSVALRQAELSREMVRKAKQDLRETGRLARLLSSGTQLVVTHEQYEQFDQRMAEKYHVVPHGHMTELSIADWRPSTEYIELLGFGNVRLSHDLRPDLEPNRLRNGAGTHVMKSSTTLNADFDSVPDD